MYQIHRFSGDATTFGVNEQEETDDELPLPLWELAMGIWGLIMSRSECNGAIITWTRTIGNVYLLIALLKTLLRFLDRFNLVLVVNGTLAILSMTLFFGFFCRLCMDLYSLDFQHKN